MGEFDLIERFFKRPAPKTDSAHAANSPPGVGIGDDCALLPIRPHTQLAVSSDMLVEGTHFFPKTNPRRLGHKALAVNLSDLAACGARPLAFTLALSLPEVNEHWLSEFSAGLFELADAHQCPLIGGDTTRGPLNLCITVLGEVYVVNGNAQTLLRSGAQVGDDIYVSGQLGDARWALMVLQGQLKLPQALGVPHLGSPTQDSPLFAAAQLRLEQPTPRVALGLALRGIAHAAIDVSDGLVGDMHHLLQASSAQLKTQEPLGASLNTEAALGLMAAAHALPQDLVLSCVLSGGDDYELLFTASPDQADAVLEAAQDCGVSVTCIGRITPMAGVQVLDLQGMALSRRFAGFDHFAT
jgi:thiamine-monophosphate kinase